MMKYEWAKVVKILRGVFLFSSKHEVYQISILLKINDLQIHQALHY
jgi:hypothetical protein